MAFDYREIIEYNRGIYHLQLFLDNLLVLFNNPSVRGRVKRSRMENNIIVNTPEEDEKRKKDYPAAVVLCCLKEDKLEDRTCIPPFYYGESANEKDSRKYKNQILLFFFEALGGLWKKNKMCKNPIGNCAEQHAAEILLNNNPKCGPHDIIFSSAFRPRTDEIIPYCANCKKLFF